MNSFDVSVQQQSVAKTQVSKLDLGWNYCDVMLDREEMPLRVIGSQNWRELNAGGSSEGALAEDWVKWPGTQFTSE